MIGPVTAMLRLRAGSGALLRVAVVALATHAVVYRSLLPADGEHGYFGWYAPLVAGLSAVALLGTLGVLLARATGIGGSWVPRVSAMTEPSDGVSIAVSRLAGKALGLPTSLIIDKDGCELGIVAGPVDWDAADARATIKALKGG